MMLSGHRAAALVWRQCDGQTSISDMAALLQKEMQLPANEEMIWLALTRLEQARLLRERVPRPAGTVRLSRRKFLQKAGVATGVGLLLPVVESIVAPTSAMAQYEICGCECSCADGTGISFPRDIGCVLQCRAFCGDQDFTSTTICR